MVWGMFCPVAAATVRDVRGVTCTRFRWTGSIRGKINFPSVTYSCPQELLGLTALLLRLDSRLFVLLNTIEEDLATLRVLNMLDTEVYALLDVPVPDALVDEDANRARCDIVDNACSTTGAFSTRTY